MKKLFLLLFTVLPFLAAAQLPKPKNIIIMIGDGMGYNQSLAAHYYLGRAMVWENFPVKTSMATYPAKGGEFKPSDPSSNTIATGYNPSLAWKDTSYLKKDFTESAAAATALATGIKTYNNAIGLSVNHDTLENLTEFAKRTGRSAGVVTTMPFSHATPASFVTHNIVRTNYAQIAREMILNSRCDVIMGCGNPAFDQDGNPLSGKWKNAAYCGDSIFWNEVLAGKTEFRVDGKKRTFRDTDGDGKPDPWKIISKKEDFINLKSQKGLERVLGCAEVNFTLQEERTPQEKDLKESNPYETPLLTTVPDLNQMTSGAISILAQNPEGFFLMVEGGAIDYAAHYNYKGRMIEEVADFEKAVSGVIDWVNKNSNWDETLLIVTGDHETGLLWGEHPFEPIKDQGKGNLPGMKFFYGNHTNSLVALYAKGTGSNWLMQFADEYDPVRGQFIQNTEIAQLIHFLWAVNKK